MEALPIELQSDLSLDDVHRIFNAGIIAIDCETGGLNPHRDQLYLVQVSDPDAHKNVVRTTNWHQAVNLKMVLLDEHIVKVFHFAIMDCAFLQQHLLLTVQNPYCTKIASKLARTYSNSHSLKNLVEDLFGQTIDKKNQQSYWGRSNLSLEQIQYAIQDTHFILTIKKELEAILDEKGILPTGITYSELNKRCQSFIPTLVHLWVNGWDFGKETPESIFGR